MKKILAFMLTVTMCITLCSCSVSDKDKHEHDSEPTKKTTQVDSVIDVPGSELEGITTEQSTTDIPTTEASTEPTTEATTKPTVPSHTHNWSKATCSKAKTCKICGATEGKPAKHIWKAATCTTLKTCTVCGKTEGSVGSHNMGTDGKCTICGYSINSEQYKYLAESDFRSVKEQHSYAVAIAGYVIAYTDQNGDSCILTYVIYSIGNTKFEKTTLHNLSTKEEIANPYEYYSEIAERYSGQSRIKYINLANDAMKNEIAATCGVRDMLETNTHSGAGAFVSADEMNF